MSSASNLEDDGDLKDQNYFFGNISTEESVSILHTIKKEGAFMVRKRNSTNQPYALSIYYDNKVHHTRITREPNGQYSCGEEKKSKSFNSVKEMVKYLDADPKFKLTLKFSHIVEWYKSKPSTSANAKSKIEEEKPVENVNLDYLPYYLKDAKRENVERILKENKEICNFKNGMFFIRNLKDSNDQSSSKFPYEMLVYHKSYIYYLKISKSIYGKFTIDFNDFSFDTIPEMIRYFNYEKIKISKAGDLYVCLKFQSKYVQDDDFL